MQLDLIWKRSILIISTNDVRHEVSTVLEIVKHHFLYVRESLLIIVHGKNANSYFLCVRFHFIVHFSLKGWDFLSSHQSEDFRQWPKPLRRRPKISECGRSKVSEEVWVTRTIGNQKSEIGSCTFTLFYNFGCWARVGVRKSFSPPVPAYDRTDRHLQPTSFAN